jgi:hypothetical protein
MRTYHLLAVALGSAAVGMLLGYRLYPEESFFGVPNFVPTSSLHVLLATAI